jgi:hypothetical protein
MSDELVARLREEWNRWATAIVEYCPNVDLMTEAADRIARLERENAEAAAMYKDVKRALDANSAATFKLAKAEAALADALRDAERYRWLLTQGEGGGGA